MLNTCLLASADTGGVSISAFSSLACVPVGIASYTSHEEFVSVNQVLKKYNEIKEEIKSST